MKYTLGTVSISELNKAAVMKVLDSGRLSPGNETQAFEAAYAQAHGHHYGAFVNSGQTAIELALRAQRLLLGHEEAAPLVVALPATTYISTWAAVMNVGMIPVLVDVGWDFQVNGEAFSNTEADIYLPVHLYGLSRHYSIPNRPIIEDACEASYSPNVGKFGHACHSFYTSHIITTGSGGMVTSLDSEFISLVRRLANHGRTEASGSTYVSNALNDVSRNFVFDLIGTSSKGSDLIAALGHSQHNDRMPILLRRCANSDYLVKEIASRVDCVSSPGEGPWSFQFPLIARSVEVKRDLVPYLNAHGVQTRDAMPLVTQPVIQKHHGEATPGNFPVAWQLAQRAFHVGVHQDLTQAHLDYLVYLLSSFDGGARA